ncbi:MAG: ComF family protein [Flammeovirgaceae bacterium]
MIKQEKILCFHCISSLPECNYHIQKDNPVAQKFWGRLPLFHASAYLKFSKGGQVQKILHALKYNGEEEISKWMGDVYGEILANSGFQSMFDAIIPVPLHPQKEKLRGYNQCEGFAESLSNKLNAENLPKGLRRVKFSNSQTKQTKSGRYENIKGVFQVGDKKMIEGKKILLVDDVITTGATLESCGMALLEAGAKQLSIVAMAAA